MGTNWTNEQQDAIRLRDRNLLVSAAAGAGKTASMVERIITMLTEDQPPLDIDRLLVVTFTKAAAAEMKERILAAIDQKLTQMPQDAHLVQQATLVNMAQICTIDSFCESVVRDHFHDVDLDPAFRIIQGSELKLMQHEVMTDLFEDKFQEKDLRFLDFVDAYGGKIGTDNLESMVNDVYATSMVYPNPEEWLTTYVLAYQAETVDDLADSDFGQSIREEVLSGLEHCQELAEEGLAICRSADGPTVYEPRFLADQELVRNLTQAGSAREFSEQMQQLDFGSLSRKSCDCSDEKRAQAKEIHTKCKNTLTDFKKRYFSRDPDEYLEEIKAVRPAVEELADLTRAYATRFQERKQEQNVIDFSDLEHDALKILTKETKPGVFMPSATAREYQDRFDAVMVDEYQDINQLQETLLQSVTRCQSGQYNLFMVGDVKQSIYGFRGSRPDLFLDKYNSYSKTGGPKQRIDLHQNFRSRSQVVDSVNALFRQMMRKDLGNIEYDDDAALYVGAVYDDPGPGQESIYDTELLLLDGTKNDELESRMIAGKIHELMETLQVRDEVTGVNRPVRYGDIAILTRKSKGLPDQIVKVFEQEEIPVCASDKESYFNTREIQFLLSYLQVLDNQQQDIPLAAILVSPVGGLDEEELAQIRNAEKEVPFYRAVQQYRLYGTDSGIRQKLEDCLGQMDGFRKLIPYTPIHELMWRILDETGYRDFAAALPGGEKRLANLEFLVDQARDFESENYEGLSSFLQYIEQIQEQKLEFGNDLLNEQADAVRIMTMHKSKGLEFPVVFCAGMGGQLKNGSSGNNGLIVSYRHGIGLETRDTRTRVRVKNLIKQKVEEDQTMDEMGEELRLLYVSFTRAKEKLILTGNLPTKEQTLLDGGETLTYSKRAGARTYWQWVLPAALLPDTPVSYTLMKKEDIARGAGKTSALRQADRNELEDWDTQKTYDPAVKTQLREQFSYMYPYEDAKNQQMKFTVSELKKRTHMLETMEDTPPEAELGDELFAEPDVVPLIPKFMQKEQGQLTGSDRGTAYHRVLELLDLTRTYDGNSLADAVNALVEAGKISQDMADCIRPDDLLYFLQTESGKRMRAAAECGQLCREQPFVLGVDSREIYPDAAEGDLTLVQGIIDVYFEEPDGLVVLDYKTDKVSAGRELVEKYHAQVEEYARALEQMLEKPVKEKIIYSFTLREEILL